MSEIKEISEIVRKMGNVLAGREVSIEEIQDNWNKKHPSDPSFLKLLEELKEKL